MLHHCLWATLLLLFIPALIACNNPSVVTASSSPSISHPAQKELIFDRLTGTWQSFNKKIYERWTKTSDSAYRSIVFVVKGADTLIREQATIYPKDGAWIFETLVQGQNAGKTVSFTSVALTESHVQFSNPAHDFPSQISYTVAGDTVTAFIAGANAKGGIDTIPFNYTRVR